MLEVRNISKVFRTGTFGGSKLRAVRNVSFTVRPGEVVSLIGESGSGKTTVGKMILRLTPVSSGRILFNGLDIAGLRGPALKHYYSSVQGVFQDPFSSFNPIFKIERVFRIIQREFFAHMDRVAWDQRLNASLGAVGLNAGEALGKYPHQLSGGQLQRVLIARALLLDIKVLVADEIISMLDASTRIDVLNLLGDLKQRGLSIIFVTHDLSLGNYISDKTVILRHGAIVEMGAIGKVFGDPRHPYTKMLLSSVPQLHEPWSRGELKAAAPEMETAGAPSTGDAAALITIDSDHLVASG